MNDNRRRPSSWPASLLPAMLLAALIGTGVASAASSSSETVLDMTVTTTGK